MDLFLSFLQEFFWGDQQRGELGVPKGIFEIGAGLDDIFDASSEVLVGLLLLVDGLEDVLLEVEGVILVQPGDGIEVDVRGFSLLGDVVAKFFEIQASPRKTVVIQHSLFPDFKLLI